jgi:hypothetical protein
MVGREKEEHRTVQAVVEGENNKEKTIRRK